MLPIFGSPLAVPVSVCVGIADLPIADRGANKQLHFIRHRRREAIYSHSTVAGGFEVMSYTTLVIIPISPVILLDALSKTW